MHAEADDAEGRKQIRMAWLEAMNRITDIRYLSSDESGKTSIASSRTAFGGWLQSFDKLLRLLYPDQPAAAETFLTRAIRDYVLETCPGFYPEAE